MAEIHIVIADIDSDVEVKCTGDKSWNKDNPPTDAQRLAGDAMQWIGERLGIKD